MNIEKISILSFEEDGDVASIVLKVTKKDFSSAPEYFLAISIHPETKDSVDHKFTKHSRGPWLSNYSIVIYHNEKGLTEFDEVIKSFEDFHKVTYLKTW